MGADGEAVGLVAQALQVIEHRVCGLEHERRLAGDEEPLQPGVAVRSLGDAANVTSSTPSSAITSSAALELARAAVDQHQVRPAGRRRGPPLGLALLEQAGEAARSTSRIMA